MAKAQAEFGAVKKTEKADTGKYTYTYATMEELIKETRTPLTKNGLVIIQFPVNDGDRVGVKTIVAHESGESMEEMCTTSYFRQDPQGIGSLITYMRRYAYMAVCGIAPEDDDAQDAMPATKPALSTTRVTRQVPGGTVSEVIPFCSEHSVSYFKQQKGDKTWFSHKIAGTEGWCNHRPEQKIAQGLPVDENTYDDADFH